MRKTVLIYLIFCIALLVPSVNADGTGESASVLTMEKILKIESMDNRISLEAKNAELSEVIKELSAHTGVDILLGKDVSGPVNLKTDGETLEEILERLLRNRALVYEKQGDGKGFQILKATGYQSIKGETEQKLEEGGSPPVLETGRRNFSPVASGNSNPGYGFIPGELLVQIAEGVKPEALESFHRTMGSTVIRMIPKVGLQRVRLREGLDEAVAIEKYKASGLVKTVERHAVRYPLRVPDDPFYGDQWGLSIISAPDAWEITQGFFGIVIAVVDTGVDYTHPDLAPNIWINYFEEIGDGNGDGFPGIQGVDDDGDGLIDEDSADREPGDDGYSNDLWEDDDENGYPDDFYGYDFAGSFDLDNDFVLDPDPDPMDPDGHGTHVAGIASAAGNNGIGISGVNWHTDIMSLKVLDEALDEFPSFAVLEALYYAAEMGAKIVNCSFGGKDFEKAEFDAFSYLADQGILAVCAAGNSTLSLDLPGNDNYPAEYDLPNIISVAASTTDPSTGDEILADLSNWGPQGVDLMAPGVNIKSTTPAGTYTDASVTLGETQIDAIGMIYAGQTDTAGITGTIYDCGEGYPEEFPEEVAGNIALIQRSDYSESFYFYLKTYMAMAAGAVAVIIYNNVEDDLDTNGGTLTFPDDWIPVVSVSNADGLQLLAGVGSTVTVVNAPLSPLLSYSSTSGTSMAAPFVSGVAGLMLSLDSNLTPELIRSILIDTVDPIPSVADKLVSGGRLNARAALCRTIAPALTCGTPTLEDAILGLQILAGETPDLCTVCLPSEIDINSDGRFGLAEIVRILEVVSGQD